MKITLAAIAAAAGIAALPSGLQAEEAKASTIGTLLSKVPLHRLDGTDIKEAKLEKSPEYFILYYSASW